MPERPAVARYRYADRDRPFHYVTNDDSYRHLAGLGIDNWQVLRRLLAGLAMAVGGVVIPALVLLPGVLCLTVDVDDLLSLLE